VILLLVASAFYLALFRERGLPDENIAVAEETITDTALIAMAQPIQKTESASRSRASTPNTGVDAAHSSDELTEAEANYDKIAEGKDMVSAAMEEVKAAEMATDEVVVDVMPKMEKAAYEKKDKAAVTKTIEDSAAAMPGRSVGMPDRQARPAGGMEEFNRWIQSNIRYPEDISPRVRQVVVVTFKVAADSTLHDLKAKQSADDRFTAEVFRLLHEGPKWAPAIRNDKVVEEEVRVSIVFR
jgi:hypothetical protein